MRCVALISVDEPHPCLGAQAEVFHLQAREGEGMEPLDGH